MKPGWPLWCTWSAGEESRGIVVGPSPKGDNYLATEYTRDGKSISHEFPPKPVAKGDAKGKKKTHSQKFKMQCGLTKKSLLLHCPPSACVPPSQLQTP